MWLWFLAGTAQAASKTAAPASSSGNLFSMLLPFILLFALMWFMMIRPQKKQRETHRRMLADLKKGDRVVTTGGMVGEVTDISEDEVKVRIADKVEAKFVKSAVTRVIKS